MTDAHAADDHATPLTPAERDDLIPTYITVRGELNELEQKNIATADRWAFSRRHVVTRDRFLKGLHSTCSTVSGDGPENSGRTERNLGVKPFEIETALRQALDDARYWIEHKSIPPDEIAVRFHHRLVSVHPFPTATAAGRASRPTC